MVLWTEEERRLLGLSAKEHKLLDTLYKKGTLNTLVLAFEAKIPRVTTMRLLKTLQGRGFVSRQTLLNEVRWSLTKPEVQTRKFLRVFEETPGLSAKNALSLSDVASISIFRGPQELLESHKTFLLLHPGERMYAIEPSGIWKYFAKVSAEDWTKLNRTIEAKKIIIEALLEEGFEKEVRKHVKKELGDSYLSLVRDARVLPRGSLPSSSEILIARDEALFLDWEQLVGVVIKNPSTVKLLKGMFMLLKSKSRSSGD